MGELTDINRVQTPTTPVSTTATPRPTVTATVQGSRYSHYSRTVSLAWVGVAYAVALAAAAAAMWLPLQGLWLRLLVADLVGTAVVFAFSYRFSNSSFYDPYWSLAPIVIALYLVLQVPPDTMPGARAMATLGVVCFWGVRLTLNWLRYWEGMGYEDWRYARLRQQTGRAYWLVSLTGIHYFPTALVYMGCLPLLVALAPSTHAWGVWDALGTALCLTATLLEWQADEQLYRFRQNPANRGHSMTLGLWRYSRHPNYLGEITFWYGIFFIGMGASGWELWYVYGAGAVAIHALFYFISIPMAEERHRLHKPDYEAYSRRTPKLLF